MLRSAKLVDSGHQQTSTSSIPSIKSNRRVYARLSPTAFWLLVETKPIPYTLIDVRPLERAAADEVSTRLPDMLHIPADELAAVLRNRNSTWQARFGIAIPGLRSTIVFISTHGHSASHAASLATSLGFSRCAVIEGGLAAATPLAPPPDQMRHQVASPSSTLSRDAVLLLLEYGAAQGTSLVTLIDVRRHDERTLYGAIRGSVHVPVDQLPKALLMNDQDWLRALNFPKPGPEDIIVLHCRCRIRAEWAKQLCYDAGLHRCLLYADGISGWHSNDQLKAYDMYQEGEEPPEPIQLGSVCTFDRAKAEAELLSKNLVLP